MVASRVRERVDAFLIDGNPLGDAEFLADGVNSLIDGRNDSQRSSFRLRLDPGHRITTEADTTRIMPPMTRAVASSTKPATADDNPAYVLTSAMTTGASDPPRSSASDPGCSTLNIAAHTLAQLPR
jgi:hypothetical protein